MSSQPRPPAAASTTASASSPSALPVAALSMADSSEGGRWAPDSVYLGHPASDALATRFHTLAQAMMADEQEHEDDQVAAKRRDRQAEAHTALMEQLRSGTETTDDRSDDIALTLASFALALQRLSSSALTHAQYRQLLSDLSFDVCDVLLPAMQREWERVARSNPSGGAGHASDGAGAQVYASPRPLTSATLTLLQHLLGEIAAHANPREVALALLACCEQQLEAMQEEQERMEAEHDDEQHEGQPERAVATPASVSSGLDPFHRLALALPVLDLLASLLPRMSNAPVSTTSSSSSSAPSATRTASVTAATLSVRQVELYRQLLGVFRQSLRHASTHVAQRSEAAAKAAMASDHDQLLRVHRERGQWVGMHLKLLDQCMHTVQPVLFADPSTPANTAAASSMPSSAAAAASSSRAASLRTDLLSFLFDQVARFWSVYAAEVPQLQIILEGHRAAQAATHAAAATSTSAAAAPAAPSAPLLTPELTPLLRVLFGLCDSIDRCAATPHELVSYYRAQHRLERQIDEEQARAAEAQESPEQDEASEAGERDGATADDEWNSEEEEQQQEEGEEEDEDGHTISARQAKTPSALQLLRQQQAALPRYSPLGVGLYLASAISFHFFGHIKPARIQEAGERKGTGTEATPATLPPDEALSSLLASLPNIGASFVLESQRAPPRLLLDAVAPFMAALLFQGMHSGQQLYIRQFISFATALWGVVPPGAISIPETQDDEAHSLDTHGPEETPLEHSGAWLLSESLLQCMYLCPPAWPALRSSLLQLWRSLLACLAVNTRVRLLHFSIAHCGIPSVQGLLVQRLKDEVVRAWDEESKRALEAPVTAQTPTLAHVTTDKSTSVERASFLTPDLLLQLRSYVGVAQSNVLESLDLLLACVNLFRFLMLRSQADAKRGGGEDAAAAPAQRPGDRIGLLRPSVRQEWLATWREVHALTQEAIASLDAHISEEQASAATPAGAAASTQPEAQEAASQAMMLRNQARMVGELCNVVVQHMEEA